MPRLKTFDKKTSTTYALVHRPQHDPRIHDSDAPSQIFKEIPSSSRQGKKSKVKQRGDLEQEFGLGADIRENEGEAAEHGIYYDDSSYDYMQHMRDLGGSSESTWIEAPSKLKVKGKQKQSLEDALSEVSLDDGTRSVGGESYASSQTGSYAGGWTMGGRSDRNRYQAQQDIPDELAGFQPDMDPRLREVLEALEDEEYVDDDDDIFTALAGNGEGEISREEWEYGEFDDEDDGWESDTTEKPVKEYESGAQPEAFIPASDIPHPNHDEAGIPSEDASLAPAIPEPTAEDQDFLASFAKNRAADKPSLPKLSRAQKAADAASSAMLTTSTTLGRRKKRKGALTSESGFSMTSSSLARTEPLHLLDSRFDRLVESYMEDSLHADDFDDNASLASGMTGLSKMSGMSRGSAWGGSQASQSSQAPELMPANFDSVLDDFLGGADGDKKYRPMRKAGVQGRWAKDQGLKQLDEIRAGLGPARVSGKNRGLAT